MPLRRRLVGVSLVLAATGAGAAAVAGKCSRLDQLAPAVVGALPTLVELLTAPIGVWMVYLFWPRHEGRGLHCRRCGYYQEPKGKLAPACPECGATWLWIGNTRYGRRTGALGPVLLGFALCLLALAGSVVHSVAPWVYLRLLPDRVLLAQVVALPDDATVDLWPEITRRKLPKATMDALADPLLKKKARDGYLSLAAESLVFDAMMRPSAPPASAARYFSSFLSARVEASARIEIGKEIALATRAVFRGRRLTSGAVPRVVVLSALYLGDDPEPVRTWDWEVDPETSTAQERPMDHRLSPHEPGLVRLRQAFWLAIGPPSAEPIAWKDGQPVLPVALSIKDHFEEVREVVVAPKPTKEPSGSAAGKPR